MSTQATATILTVRTARSRLRPWLFGIGLFLLCLTVLAAAFYLRPMSFIDAGLRFSLWRHGVRSEYLVADGHRMHYLEAVPPGAAPGKPLLLIHGLGGRDEDWAGMMPALARAGYHVYAPDLLGYGRSERPRDASYSIAYEEAGVLAFARAVGLTRADVGGWSMGGWIAMKIAADHPETVGKLMLYDSAGVYFPLDYDTTLFTPTDAAGFGRLMERLTPKQQKVPAYFMRDLLRRFALNAFVVRRSVAAMTSGRDLMEFRLHEIQAPTLVMWGSVDRLIPPEVGKKIAGGIPQARLELARGCGHLAPAECKDQVLPATLAFLQERAAK